MGEVEMSFRCPVQPAHGLRDASSNRVQQQAHVHQSPLVWTSREAETSDLMRVRILCITINQLTPDAPPRSPLA